MKPPRNGFTIIELMISIIVIAILAGLAILTYAGIQNDAQSSRARAMASIVQSGLEKYYEANLEYPTPRLLAGSSNLTSTATPPQSDFQTAATTLGIASNTLVDPSVRFAPCVVGTTGSTPCTPSASNTSWVYYLAKDSTSTAAYSPPNLGCSISLSTGEQGATGYVVAFYDSTARKWLFKQSLNGAVAISGTGCAAESAN